MGSIYFDFSKVMMTTRSRSGVHIFDMWTGQTLCAIGCPSSEDDIQFCKGTLIRSGIVCCTLSHIIQVSFIQPSFFGISVWWNTWLFRSFLMMEVSPKSQCTVAKSTNSWENWYKLTRVPDNFLPSTFFLCVHSHCIQFGERELRRKSIPLLLSFSSAWFLSGSLNSVGKQHYCKTWWNTTETWRRHNSSTWNG